MTPTHCPDKPVPATGVQYASIHSRISRSSALRTMGRSAFAVNAVSSYASASSPLGWHMNYAKLPAIASTSGRGTASRRQRRMDLPSSSAVDRKAYSDGHFSALCAMRRKSDPTPGSPSGRSSHPTPGRTTAPATWNTHRAHPPRNPTSMGKSMRQLATYEEMAALALDNAADCRLISGSVLFKLFA